MQAWHTLSANNTLKELETDPKKGLSGKQVKHKHRKFGKNTLVEKSKKKPLYILFDQFKETMVIVLLLAAFVTIFLIGEILEGSVILVIVLLNAVLGFWQEFQAEEAMAALKKLAVPRVRVKRDGRVQELQARNLVPGDVVLLEAGNLVPGDARLISSVNLRVQESTLTGEAEPVEKDAQSIQEEDAALANRINMVYMGTVVTYGRGEAVITETGMSTQLGQIAGMLQSVGDDKTLLQKRLAQLGRILAWAAGALILAVAGISWLQGMRDLNLIFMTGVSMAVAAVPEGLPAVVTIALALGARRMLKKKALIRKLVAVETLGSVTVICSDKTGTLTQNKMRVTQLVFDGTIYPINDLSKTKLNKPLNLLLTCASLCNDAVAARKKGAPAIGDPTETALVEAAAEFDLLKNNLEKISPRSGEVPFDSVRKRMTTVHTFPKSGPLTFLKQTAGKKSHVALVKGAVDGLLSISDRVLTSKGIQKLTPSLKKNILKQNDKMAGQAVRVLGYACKPTETANPHGHTDIEKKLIFIGLTGMVDPVRPEAIAAIATCQKAGIRTVMITGDHPITAQSIADQLGMGGNGKVHTGKDLEKMNNRQLKKAVRQVSIYARVSPEHKMRLVDALQANGQTVSMTGDGVNDAPALKSADIGVSMGITGTDVAKGASDMVLLDDNFATIVSAVREGRTIYDNIRKFLKYILTGNVGEIIVMLAGPFLGMPLALFPIQILWINLVTDGVPGIALGYEEAESDTMARPPYKTSESMFARGVGRQILWIGTLVAAVSLMIGGLFKNQGQVWQTMVFTTLTLSQLQFALSSRSSRSPLFGKGFFNNKIMIMTIAGTLLLQVSLLYIPFLQKIFRTMPLSFSQLGVCFAGSMIVLFAAELEKWILRIRAGKV